MEKTNEQLMAILKKFALDEDMVSAVPIGN